MDALGHREQDKYRHKSVNTALGASSQGAAWKFTRKTGIKAFKYEDWLDRLDGANFAKR